MSRNLCTSSCCNNIVRLGDLRGKPIEFRRYGDSPPVLGTRWDCPTCGTAYFAWWNEAPWYKDKMEYGNFVIDLSYYATFNDEPDYEGEMDLTKDKPEYLCEDNAEDRQDVW